MIHVRKKGKADTMRFSSDFTQQILTQALTFQSKFAVDQNVARMVRFCQMTCVLNLSKAFRL